MKLIKGFMAVVALAGAALVTGCSDCAPVREEIVTTTYGGGCPSAVAELETIEAAPLMNSCSGGEIY